LAEAALAGVTVAAVVGLVRLFSDGSFLLPLVAVALLAHGLAIVVRRLGLNPLVAVLVSGVGLAIAVGWVVEPHTLTLGLPLGRTWRAVDLDLRTAWARFGEVRAPTPVIRGFVLACAGAVWMVAFAADSFAFRARARFEALAPSFVLFLFGAVLGAERYRLAAGALYLAAVLAFVVLAEAGSGHRPSWFAERSGDGDRARVRSGMRTAAVAVAVALLVAPRLPGAHSLGVVGWRDGGEKGSSSRVTVSPLVDIRSRLVNPSGAELFTVHSPVPSYWRLTSLERFDGTIWASVGSYEPARGTLPTGVSSRATEEAVPQQFDIRALSTIWLPAAYRAQRFDGPRGVRFDPDSSSLLTDADTSNGLRYSVESSVPRLTADELAPAAPTVPADLARIYLALPEGFPDSVRQTARQVTRGDAATCAALGCTPAESAAHELSPFHKARALQDWFQSTFTYDLSVPAGHDESAIKRFLTVKRGYCEQFAGTFAAMARSLGLPSRVAVGFTPGSSTGADTYRVTDREAHAWPEVYLGAFGWVAFEPTPSRALPGGEAYTGVGQEAPVAAPDQAGATSATTPTTAEGAGGSPATTEPGPSTAAGDTGRPGSRWPLPGTGVTLALLAAALYLIGVPVAGRVRRSRRRAGAGTPTARVLVAWEEAGEDLALAGLGRRPAETANEYAERARVGAAGAAPALAELAGHLSAAAFSPAGVDEAAAVRAEAAAAVVRADVRVAATPGRRALWALDPRPLARAASDAVESRRGRREQKRQRVGS
jgi:transglutaminase-like putative cysteine protease